VRVFSGVDLDLIADAEGTTGFILDLTMKVQPKEELEIIAIGCPEVDDLQKIVEDIVKANLPLWSLVFINPRMAENEKSVAADGTQRSSDRRKSASAGFPMSPR